jgi:hypothetical protein
MPHLIAGFVARTAGTQLLGKIMGGNDDEKKAESKKEGGLPPPLDQIAGALGALPGGNILKDLLGGPPGGEK